MPSWQPTSTYFARLSDLLGDPGRRRALLGTAPVVPDEVADYLARLYLLQGVPFNYLVPDPRMLPEESIRFFLLDPNWLNALLDGAMSVGRVTSNDAAQDDAVKSLVLRKAAEYATTLRPTFGAAPPAPDPGATWSGFLLRSAVVAGWPGLEVDAYEDAEGTTPLAVLRMERLSPTVLLGIFGGVYRRLDLHEPAEGIHFGADYHPAADGAGSGAVYSKPFLRGLEANDPSGAQPGALVQPPGVPAVPVPTRGNRVVNLAEFAAALPGHLKDFHIQGPPTLTAAEFAVEMVEGAYRQSYSTAPPAPRPLAATARTFAAELPAEAPSPAADALAAERERLAAYLFGGPNA